MVASGVLGRKTEKLGCIWFCWFFPHQDVESIEHHDTIRADIRVEDFHQSVDAPSAARDAADARLSRKLPHHEQGPVRLAAVCAGVLVEHAENGGEEASGGGGARDMGAGAELGGEVESGLPEGCGPAVRLGGEDGGEGGEGAGVDALVGADLAAREPAEAGDAQLRMGERSEQTGVDGRNGRTDGRNGRTDQTPHSKKVLYRA